MWLVETLNSTYRVEALGTQFKVTKIAGGVGKYYLSEGEHRLHNMVALEVGKRGYFDSIVTTTVKSVKEVSLENTKAAKEPSSQEE